MGTFAGVMRFVLETVDDYYDSSSPLLAGVVVAAGVTIVFRILARTGERSQQRRLSGRM